MRKTPSAGVYDDFIRDDEPHPRNGKPRAVARPISPERAAELNRAGSLPLPPGRRRRAAPDGSPGPASEFALTDMGNAQRFVADHGANVRYCFPWRKWLVWDGRRWRLDDVGEVSRLAKATVRRMYATAAAKLRALQDDDLDDEAKAGLTAQLKALLSHALKSQDARALSRMLDLARSESGVPVLPADLDRDRWLLNCDNGTLDLRTGKLRPHDQADLLTKLCPTAYQSAARCPHFLRTLGGIFQRDAGLIDFVHCSLGYALTGDVREQVLPIWWGGGANGKSTLLGTILETIGTDYAGTVPVELLMETPGDKHPTILADLFGKRLMVAAETDEGKRLNEGRLKMLTGGERVKARRMREDFWEFDPTHKIILITNHKPAVRGTDHAIWRRLRLVPFAVTFLDPEAPENKGKVIPDELRIDRTLPGKLQAEREGVLAWLVAGCLRWQEKGLPNAKAIQDATNEYRDAEDTVAAFIAERCVIHDDVRAKASDLYSAFNQWAEASGERINMSRKRFGQELTARGYESCKSDTVWYRGLKLSTDYAGGWED